jgi:hypothetical protein
MHYPLTRKRMALQCLSIPLSIPLLYADAPRYFIGFTIDPGRSNAWSRSPVGPEGQFQAGPALADGGKDCFCPPERSVLHGWPKSSQPYKPALSRGKVSVQAGQPMQAGCGIPRCR